MGKSSSRALADLRDEQRSLLRLTADLDCAQQKFFQGEYGRHRRSPTGALLLCLLLGNFGAHELYLGRLASGLIRLLFSWTLIPWLVALCEAPWVPGRARRYNAELAQGIVDLLHELRAHVRALDPAPAVAAGATVVQAPKVAPIILRPTDASLLRAQQVAMASTQADHQAPSVAAWLAGGASLAALSAIAAEAVGYRRASEHDATAEADTTPTQAELTAAPVIWPVATPSCRPANDADAMGDQRTVAVQAAPTMEPAPATVGAAEPATVGAAEPATVGAAEPATAPVVEQDARHGAVVDAAVVAAAAVPVFAYSLGAASHAPVRYGPPLDATPAPAPAPTLAPTPAVATPAPAPTPAQPVWMRRIVVRKVALVDGEIAAEAIASREVPVDDPTSPLPLEERLRLATDDARNEALRLLAERVSADVRADAAQQFGEFA